jgi:colanic acid/amylovoran biosynthesis glycosyltransferase
MLKVTFCAYDKPDNVGGPPAWLQRLLPALRERGIDASCLFFLHWGDTGPSVEFLRSQGFDCPAIPAPSTTEERVRWILERLQENPPDVFVPNLVVAGYLAGQWVRDAGIPTLGILHSDDAFYRAFQDQFVFGRPQDRLSALVCVSQELERQVMDRRPASTRIARIRYGVPVPLDAVQRRPRTLRVAYVGRLVEEQKRISEVTRAFCRVTREVPGTEAVIYGEGPDRILVEKILKDEAAGSVRLGGLVDSNQIQQHMLACDVIVLLSDYEGLPIALMEAMACGCVPVCLRMRSGIPELVADGVNGLLVDDRGDGFEAAIRRLRDEPGLWQRLSLAAKARIQEEFSDTVCNGKWAGMLHELHASAEPRKVIKIPRRIRLPNWNPALETAENRLKPPALPLRLWRKGRIFAGRVRRMVRGKS